MTANVSSAIREGFRLARKLRGAAAILFAANLALAAIAALPIYSGILEFTGFRSIARELGSGFSPDWFVDFSFNRPGTLDRAASFILYMGVLALPVNAILAGGVLARFRARDASFSFRDFFRDCNRFAWPLLRLGLMGLICYWLVFRIVNVWLGRLVEERTFNTLDDRVYFWPHFGLTILLILGLAAVNLIMDFAQVRLVLVEGSTALEAFVSSLGFALTRLPSATLVYAIPSAAGVLPLILYRLLFPWNLINSAIGSAATGSSQEVLTLLLLFILQQVVMFARYWFRVATWGSEWAYYEAARASAHNP
jgi:hypothetical protein